MKLIRTAVLLISLLAGPHAFSLGLIEVTYPVFLPYNQGDQEIELRTLVFATRSPSPEHLGSALSSSYIVPSADSADLPKDINLISGCGIHISTMMGDRDQGRWKGRIALTVDLRDFSKPEYLPRSLSEMQIISSVAQAILTNTKKRGWTLDPIEIEAAKEQKALKEKLEALLRNKKGEQDAGGKGG